MSDFFDDSQGDNDITYKPSVHAFTDPIRYFKANDPYYWEVDNIPLNQIQSNILWLKDQISAGGITEVGDVTRSNFLELRPGATGDNRTVSVQPGRFMGRVNDAYGTGLFKIAVDAYTSYEGDTFERQESITIPDAVLLDLIGSTVNNLVNNNGLYDLLQTHASNNRPTATIVDWGNYYTTDVRNDLGVTSVYDIPKIKLALWGQDTTTHSYYGPLPTDLQQRAVAWTRAWGAPFRTSLVNVEETMYINVPDFSEDDYSNESNYVPSVRVDLLFVYTKPIDAASTTIAKPVGSSPANITSPQLGLVRGAGVISLAGGGIWAGDTVDSAFLGSTSYTSNSQDQNQKYWLKEANAFDANGNSQISSPVGDLNQTSIGTSGVYGNFPSPDDLMNLAPYITSDLIGTKSVALVGQSVLPIAYIFVRKGQITITESDILDIRPFFRTTELTYNERSGIAAASPPISIANPVVSDSDVTNRIKRLYTKLKDMISDNPPGPPGPPGEDASTLIASRTYALITPECYPYDAYNDYIPIPFLTNNLYWTGDLPKGIMDFKTMPAPGYDPSALISPAGVANWMHSGYGQGSVTNSPNKGLGYAYFTLKKGYVYKVNVIPRLTSTRLNSGYGASTDQAYYDLWRTDGTSNGQLLYRWGIDGYTTEGSCTLDLTKDANDTTLGLRCKRLCSGFPARSSNLTGLITITKL